MPDGLDKLSRRQILGSIGTVGAAGAMGGAGTLAFFSDEEELSNNQIEAGELDLKVDWIESYNGVVQESWPPGRTSGEWVSEAMTGFDRDELADVPQDLQSPLIQLDDVKPGDRGEVTLSYHLFGNPGFIGLCGELLEDVDNGITEPEDKADGTATPGSDGTPDGDLADAINATLWYDPDCSNTLDDGEVTITEGTLREVLEEVSECVVLDPVNSGGSTAQEFPESLCHEPGIGGCEETLYLIENVGNGSAGDAQTPATDDGPFIFEVDLVGGNAELSDLTAVPDRITAGHIAATPDGESIFVIDRDTGHLAEYDVGSGTFSNPGQISDHPSGVVLIAFSPDGTLFMASNGTDELYKVDNLGSSPTANSVGDTGINVQGADIAFSADGTLFLYSNAEGSGTLFTVDTSDGTASEVGETGVQLTGLAVRSAGTGDLVGSTTNPSNDIVVFDRNDGSLIDQYPMRRGGAAYNYDFGDMTVGQLCTGSQCVAMSWELPRDVGNIVQSDRVRFQLGFQAVQCRHNVDELGMPASPIGNTS